MFYLIDNQAAYRKLKEELVAALPDHSATVTIAKLEPLPYLISTRFPDARAMKC